MTTIKPTVPDVIALMRQYEDFAEESLGCGPLHIFIEDGNIHDGDLRMCMEWAELEPRPDHRMGLVAICRILLRMSPTQRKKIYKSYDR